MGQRGGADVERVRPVAAAKIARRYFPAEEAAAVAARPVRTAPELFFRLWVRKEASVKAWGGRLVQGLRTPVCPTAREWPCDVTTLGGDGRSWRVRDLTGVAAPTSRRWPCPGGGAGRIEVRTLTVDEFLDRGPTAGRALRE
ncbi:4'-phosphopantetheinyl transferase superfamily protein [Streptomyces sp. INA 01156]